MNLKKLTEYCNSLLLKLLILFILFLYLSITSSETVLVFMFLLISTRLFKLGNRVFLYLLSIGYLTINFYDISSSRFSGSLFLKLQDQLILVTPQVSQIQIFFSIVFGLAMAFCLFQIQRKFFNNILIKILFGYLSIFLIFLIFDIMLVRNSAYSALVLCVCIVMSKSIHFLSYSHLNLEYENKKSNFDFLTKIFPFWWDTLLAPRPASSFEVYDTKRHKLDQQAFVLSLLSLLFYHFGSLIRSLAFGYPFLNIDLCQTITCFNFIDTSKVGYLYPIEFSTPRIDIVLTILLRGLAFFFQYLAAGLLFVDACLRWSGISMPLHFQNPIKSKTFSEFFNSIMYYYSLLITNVFVIPTLHFLKNKIKNRKLRKEVSLYFGITFGGFIIHFIRDINYNIEYGLFYSMKRQIVNSLVYFSLIYLFLKLYKNGFANQTVNLVALLASYFFILYFRFDFMTYGEVDKVKLILYLLGFL